MKQNADLTPVEVSTMIVSSMELPDLSGVGIV